MFTAVDCDAIIGKEELRAGRIAEYRRYVRSIPVVGDAPPLSFRERLEKTANENGKKTVSRCRTVFTESWRHMRSAIKYRFLLKNEERIFRSMLRLDETFHNPV